MYPGKVASLKGSCCATRCTSQPVYSLMIDESGLHHDYEQWLERLAPHAPVNQYRHNVGEDNADAHMKRQIMGREVVCAITDGKLDFGTWEQIFYGGI